MADCYLGSTTRTNSYGPDPEFAKQFETSANQHQLVVSGGFDGYSRGHQIPSNDRTASEGDNETTFYATNMTPQLSSLNNGAWQQLETQIHDKWCSTTDTLYVVTGAHFDKGNTTTTREKNGTRAIPVPTHYWKVLLSKRPGVSANKPVWECTEDDLRCIGFIFDHAAGSWSWTSSACTVEEVEALTEFSFFANVPAAPKSKFIRTDWDF